MKIKFLGTAASESVPNPFCRCEHCQMARSVGGKEIRTHSSAIIDDVMLIDLSPTFTLQLLMQQMDATSIESLLFTHTHADHFNAGELYSRMEGFSHTANHPLHIFGNDKAISGCISLLPGYTSERFAFHCLVPFVTVQHQGYNITPLLANHAKWEHCYVYHIEKEGRSLFYGHDSGWFPELTWQWLSGKQLDLIVLECTYGFNGNSRSDNHMSFETIFDAQQRLIDMGCINQDTQLALSHISHTSNLSHSAMEEFCTPKNIRVAYDGYTMTSQ
ncbi:MBL fold metallo-hydrolase [Providencia sp. Je.9.19]|uniref:MBL fold metallo-hydrolase n=1 Tax=Providencia sp. Je.9.19 TaxID=3142844 RepID=UPI003DA9EA49